MLPVVAYCTPAEKTPEVAAPMRIAPPGPLAHKITPAATTAAAATYCQLSANQSPAAARPVLWESLQEASSASVSGCRPEGSLIPTGLLPA